MAVELPSRPISARRSLTRVQKAGKSLVVAALELIDLDPAMARSELETLMGQIAAQLAELGDKPVRDASQAAREHKPLRVGPHLFVPTATQVLRQRANPS